ncbi:hypothetical protein ACRAWD_26510 [Caulobacter segnis]
MVGADRGGQCGRDWHGHQGADARRRCAPVADCLVLGELQLHPLDGANKSLNRLVGHLQNSP